MTTDITKLTGADLFDAIGTGKKISVKRPPKDKLSPKAPTLKWKDDKLVLMVHITECTCGHCYEHPNEILFLRRTANDGSLHYVDIENKVENPEERFMDIPVITEYNRSYVKACQFCFDILHIMDRARAPKQQETKDLSPVDGTKDFINDNTPRISTGLGDITETLMDIPTQPILGG